jgi:hypothetical protein
VARKKDTEALFEVISKNKEKHMPPKFGIPEWMAKDCRPKTDPDTAAPEESEAPPAEPPAEAVPEPPPAVARPEPAPMRFDEPVFEIDHGRMKISLSIVSAGVAVLGVLVLLGAAFWLGRQSAPSTEPGDGEPVAAGVGHQGTPTPAPKPGPKKPIKKPGPIAGPGKLEKGKYYLVVQSLQGTTETHRLDAEAIATFCAAKQVPAIVMKYTPSGSGRATYHVWSLKPFKHADTLNEIGTRYAAQIEDMGREYARGTRGKYSFGQRNSKGEVEGWFLPY